MKISKKISILFLFFMAVQLLAFSCECRAESGGYIRVAILQGVKSLRLKINGFYEIVNPENNALLFRGKDLYTTVTTGKRGFLFGTAISAGNKVLVRPDSRDAISIDGRKFLGGIELIKKDGAMLVINVIELEDYIKGILYHEASHY